MSRLSSTMEFMPKCHSQIRSRESAIVMSLLKMEGGVLTEVAMRLRWLIRGLVQAGFCLEMRRIECLVMPQSLRQFMLLRRLFLELRLL